MQVITIQHKRVLDYLKYDNVYHAEMSRVPENRRSAYWDMCNYYGWGFCPIFGCEIGQPSHLDDGKWENGVALQLEVPDTIARRQYYYDWSDVIYFLEFPDEFKDTFDLTKVPDIKAYEKLVFDFVDQGGYKDVQVTMPILKKEWITAVSQNPLAVIEGSRYDDVLRPLSEYDPFTVACEQKTSIFDKGC